MLPDLLLNFPDESGAWFEAIDDFDLLNGRLFKFDWDVVVCRMKSSLLFLSVFRLEV